jgi:hypothetical protein
VTRLADGGELPAVLSSLAVELPAPRDRPAGAARRLVVYSSAPGAFDVVAPEVLVLLDMGRRRVTVDGHLVLPSLEVERLDLAHHVADASAVARAHGVLLDRGMVLEEGRTELTLRAAAGEITLSAAARVLLAETADEIAHGRTTRPDE